MRRTHKRPRTGKGHKKHSRHSRTRKAGFGRAFSRAASNIGRQFTKELAKDTAEKTVKKLLKSTQDTENLNKMLLSPSKVPKVTAVSRLVSKNSPALMESMGKFTPKLAHATARQSPPGSTIRRALFQMR